MILLKRLVTDLATIPALSRIGPSTRWIADQVAGYDVFISYAWSDGRNYAVALANVLQDRGLRVFLDDTRMDAGQPLREALARALRQSSVLAVIVTDDSLASGHVSNEIRAFAATKRNIIPVVPPHLVRAMRKPPLGILPHLPEDASKAVPEQCRRFNLITLADRIWLEESNAVGESQPDIKVVGKLGNAVGGFRRARIRSALTIATTALFAILAVFALVQWNTAEDQRNIAQANEQEATRERDRAVTNEQIATSRRLAAQSLTARETQLDLALLLALSASDVKETREATEVLLGTLAEGPPVLRYLREHDAAVAEILHLEDGAFVTGSFDGKLIRWSADGQAGETLALPSGQPIQSMALISSGRFAIGDFGGNIWLLDEENLTVKGSMEIPGFESSAVHVIWNSEDQTLIAGYTNGAVFSWSENTEGMWMPRLIENLNRKLQALTRGPGSSVIVGTNQGEIALIYTRSNDAIRLREVTAPSAQSPEVFLKGIAYDAESNRLAFDDGNGGVQIIGLDSFEEGTALMCHRHRNDVYEIAIGQDRIYSVGSDGRLRISEIGQTCETVAEFQVTGLSQWSLSLDPNDPDRLITGAGDGSVQLWDLARPGPTTVSHDDAFLLPSSLRFAPDDQTVVVTGMADQSSIDGAGFARAYNADDLRPLGDRIIGLTGPVSEVVFRDDEPLLLIGYDGLLEWADVMQSSVTLLPTDLAQDIVWPGVIYAYETGRVVLARRGGRVELCETKSDPISCEALPWESSTETFHSELPWHSDGETFRSAAISADGSVIALGGNSGMIYVLNGETGLQTRQPLARHRLEVTGLQFGRDSNTLFSASLDGALLIWDIASGDARSFESEIGALQQLTVSEDEQMIAVASQRGDIALWGKNGEERLGAFQSGLATAVLALRFNNEGDRLAAAAMDGGNGNGQLVIWEVGMERLRETACQIAGRTFTEAERADFQIPSEISPCL